MNPLFYKEVFIEPLDYLLRLISSFERRFNCELAIDYVDYEFLSEFFPRACYVNTLKYQMIKIPFIQDTEILKEYCWHEIAHAYYNSFHVKRSILKAFDKYKEQSWLEYNFKVLTNKLSERPEGFITSYATINAEEDFAETFSAYLCNRNKYLIHYNGESIDIRTEPILLKKFEAIHELLN